MSPGSFLIAVLCPPAHCAIYRRWPGFIVATPFWALGLWLAWRGIPLWRSDPGVAIAGLAFWLFGIAVALSYSWRWLRPLKYVVLIVLLFVSAVTLFQDVGKKARLAADQGTIAALRSASAIYYGKNGGIFPTQATLQTLIQGFNGTFGCPGATWSADTTNGKITYTPNTLDAC